MKDKELVILAYSGGLDTSVAIPWLKENYNAEVITVTADLGQDSVDKNLEEKATIAVENFEAKQDTDNVTKADCEAVVVAMKAFTDCLPDGQEKQDALASVALLQVFCAFIN